ncbi:MAG: hypothetical protein QG656_363, partial [Candidatus Hydrogenedentes bacterium]|nr:hypothetical protein [Candidatus Hydrogenedentota bacterium]
ATRSYGAALQGAEAEVTASAPAVFTEEWTLVPRGR